MGCSTSRPLGEPTNEGASSKLSHIATHVNDVIEMGSSTSLPHTGIDGVRLKSDSSVSSRDNNKTIEKNEHSESVEDLEYWSENLQDKQDQANMTDKECGTRKEDVFLHLNVAIDKIGKISDPWQADQKWQDELRNTFALVANIYWMIEKIVPSSVDLVNKYRLEAGKKISETKCTSVMCQVVIGGWRKCYTKEEDKVVAAPSGLMCAALSALWNLSDCSPEITYDIVREMNFLDTLKEILITYPRIQMQNMEQEDDYLLHVDRASLNIVNNTSQRKENITRLRDIGFVRVITMYLDDKYGKERLTALATLANIMDENESKILQNMQDLFQYFLKLLEIALQQPTHRCPAEVGMPISAKECTLTIHRLSKNHANKKYLVEMGCLPLLVKLVNIGTDEERREAVGAIWFLAFDKDNQMTILEDIELNIVNLLLDVIEQSADKTIKEAAYGTLRLLGEELQQNKALNNKVRAYSNVDKLLAAVKRDNIIDTTDMNDKKGRIMISYSWGNQKEVIQIRDKLVSNGYAVWMDITNMHGSTLQAMGEAVEKADVVLICISKKYNESDNCQLEAEYAYGLRKKMVPLKMEEGYRPNGWLGIWLGMKLFYDFSGKYSFEDKIEELLNGLSFYFNKESSETQDYEDTVDAAPASVTQNPHAPPDHQTSLATIRNLTQKEVIKWFEKNNLSKEQFGHLTGKDLAALVRMKQEATEYFYSWLKEELKIKSLSTMDTFIDALEHL